MIRRAEIVNDYQCYCGNLQYVINDEKVLPMIQEQCVCVCVCVNVITETVAMEIVTCVTKVAVATYYKIVSLRMSCREQ